MSSVFDIVNSINYDKKKFTDVTTEKEYNSFTINRFLMQDKINIFAVNEVNKMPNISKEMHYDFLKNIIPKHKCFEKHSKKIKTHEEEIEIVSSYYKVNKLRALNYFLRMSTKQYERIKNIVEHGNHDMPIGGLF